MLLPKSNVSLRLLNSDQSNLTPIALFNEDIVPREQLHIELDDIGFVMGTTISERLRTFGGQLFQAEEHFARLALSLESLGIASPELLSRVQAAAIDIVAHNSALCGAGSDLGLVVLVTPGRVTTNEPTVLVYSSALPFSEMHSWYSDGVSLQVVSHRQVPENCWPSHLKCRSRMHYYLADQEARSKQSESRALLLDQHDNIAEASTANLLIYIKDTGFVSPRKENILSGISLSVLENLAAQLGVNFQYADFSVADLMEADEVMLCSTSPSVWAVRECNGQACGAGADGEMVLALQRGFSDLVGIDIVAQAAELTARQRDS
jgi:branched-subunit amino acid aminotransferase/4-amino-4-deoxychorismate lyase